jgi:hypothetical protein
VTQGFKLASRFTLLFDSPLSAFKMLFTAFSKLSSLSSRRYQAIRVASHIFGTGGATDFSMKTDITAIFVKFGIAYVAIYWVR